MVATWAILLAVLLLQSPALLRRQQWVELGVFLFMWSLGAVYATFVLLDALPVNPTDILIQLLSWVMNLGTGKT